MGALGQEERLSEVIREAAFDPAKWRDVCDGFAEYMGGVGSVILPTEAASPIPIAAHSDVLDEGLEVYFKDEWYKRDVRRNSLPLTLPRGWAIDADCIANDDVGRSDFYASFLPAYGLKWFAGLAFGSNQTQCMISIQRGTNSEAFKASDIARVLPFRNMLSSAASIAEQLGLGRVKAAASVLEQQGRAVIAIGSLGRATYVSSNAERHCGEVIDISSGRLRAVHESARTAMERLVDQLTRGYRVIASPKPVVLPRGEHRSPLIVYGCRLPDVEMLAFQPAVALLVLVDPEKPQDLPAELFMDYFGITRAEARLAISLVKGVPLHQHAKDSGISISTARNHLQSLQFKTMTRSSAQLVALLSRVVY